MPLLKAILITAGLYIAAIVAFDVIAVLLLAITDILSFRGRSTLLFYTVWVVMAIFGGVMYFGITYDYVKENELIKNHNWLLIFISGLLSIILIWFFDAQGQMEDGSSKEDYFVPGNAGMTYTYFITFILAATYAWYIEKPFVTNKKK